MGLSMPSVSHNEGGVGVNQVVVVGGGGDGFGGDGGGGGDNVHNVSYR
jgi:hypothetical protein